MEYQKVSRQSNLLKVSLLEKCEWSLNYVSLSNNCVDKLFAYLMIDKPDCKVMNFLLRAKRSTSDSLLQKSIFDWISIAIHCFLNLSSHLWEQMIKLQLEKVAVERNNNLNQFSM